MRGTSDLLRNCITSFESKEYESRMSETTAAVSPQLAAAHRRVSVLYNYKYAQIRESRTITDGARHPYVPTRGMNPNRANVFAQHKKPQSPGAM
jgi:hypothetical protein